MRQIMVWMEVLSFFSRFLRQNTENIIPIMPSHLWCSARFSSGAPTFHPLHYSTQLSHQSLLNRPSSVYADGTQLFISSPNSFSDFINHLLHVKQISSWMTSNLLCLNPSKTEFLLIGLRDQ